MKKNLLLAFILLFFIGVNAQKRVPGPVKKVQERTALSVLNMDESTTTTTDLVNNILGPGITGTNISFTGLSGSPASAGIFSGGLAAGLGFDSGIILSSGYISNAIGPNTLSNTSAALSLSGDSDLDNLIPHTTYDATILEFDFALVATSIYIEFIFASEEYNEYATSGFNDVFAFFLDGANIALIPGTSTPVSVNTVNHLTNTTYYNDNTASSYNIECDGFTTTLSGTFPLNTNPNHTIKLAIADAGDAIYDSWVFIRSSSFSIPIEVDLGDDKDICDGQVTVLDAGNPGYSFEWSTAETTQSITVDSEGDYSVTVSYLGNSESDDVHVTVNPLPTADAGDDALIYIGYPPLETQLLATGGVQYLWSPALGLDDPTIANPVAQPEITTTYTVLVTDANGCVDTDDVIVEVNDIRCGKKMVKVLVCHVPPGNAGNSHTICISPNAVPAHLQLGDYLGDCNGPGIAPGLKSSLSDNIPEFNDNDWSIYPNPVFDQATINLSKLYGYEVELTVFDITGKAIWKYPNRILETSVIQIDLKSMPSGIYNIVLQTNYNTMVRKLVIIE